MIYISANLSCFSLLTTLVADVYIITWQKNTRENLLPHLPTLTVPEAVMCWQQAVRWYILTYTSANKLWCKGEKFWTSIRQRTLRQLLFVEFFGVWHLSLKSWMSYHFLIIDQISSKKFPLDHAIGFFCNSIHSSNYSVEKLINIRNW